MPDAPAQTNFSVPAEADPVWESLVNSARTVGKEEPALAPLLNEFVLSHPSFERALASRLAAKLAHNAEHVSYLNAVFTEVLENTPEIGGQIRRDLLAVIARDPACDSVLTPFLWFKGFLALTSHRIAHRLWQNNRRHFALLLQSLVSEVFTVDIHPAARFGSGILIDHATGFVAGETAVVEDDVSILHEVTLGGTGKERGDRHPKVRRGVLIGAGAKILGNIEIGECAKVGAGSVVLDNVPAHASVAGVPAKIIGTAREDLPAFGMDHRI